MIAGSIISSTEMQNSIGVWVWRRKHWDCSHNNMVFKIETLRKKMRIRWSEIERPQKKRHQDQAHKWSRNGNWTTKNGCGTHAYDQIWLWNQDKIAAHLQCTLRIMFVRGYRDIPMVGSSPISKLAQIGPWLPREHTSMQCWLRLHEPSKIDETVFLNTCQNCS